MSAPVDVLGDLLYASVSMACAPEIPGYNGDLFALSKDAKERIERDIDAIREVDDELIDALNRIDELGCVLRVGVPDLMDLQSLSGALKEAVETAHYALERVGGAK